MFAGRASAAGAAVGPSAAAGGKGGKLSVEELYGFNKKPKVNKGNCGKSEKADGKKEAKDKEESALASHILEAARRLMERRRLEIYLKECDVTGIWQFFDWSLVGQVGSALIGRQRVSRL